MITGRLLVVDVGEALGGERLAHVVHVEAELAALVALAERASFSSRASAAASTSAAAARGTTTTPSSSATTTSPGSTAGRRRRTGR